MQNLVLILEKTSSLKLAMILGSILIALLLILIAIPKSKLRATVLQIVGWSFNLLALLSILYIANPLDLIPDFIPFLGQLDDLAALISAIFEGIIGISSVIIARRELREIQENEDRERLLP